MDERAYPGAPRWVKIFGAALLVLLILLLVLLLFGPGEHGPARHFGALLP